MNVVRIYERRAGPRLCASCHWSAFVLVHVSLRFVPLVHSYERRARPRFVALLVTTPQL